MHASRRRSSFFILAAFVAVAATVSCGGGSPAGPSGSATLQGVVLQGGSGASAQSLPGVSAQSASGGRIVVTVRQNPALTVTVSGNGTFQIDGVPTDGFTLVFTLNGVTIGTISISPVQGVTKIKIVVQVTNGEVELVNLELDENETDTSQGDNPNKTCMINGGKVGARIELEGNVDSGSGDAFKMAVNGNRATGLVDISASGASYKCNGQKKGTDCKASLAPGDKVHVRGTLTSCTTTVASVTATEVKVQK